MAGPPAEPYLAPVLDTLIDHVFAAAHAACADPELAAEATRRVLVADPHAPADSLAARAALLTAARTAAYAPLAPADRDAIVLARSLGWKTDQIAAQLNTTPAEIRSRLARGLRTLLPPRDCAGAASPGRAAHAS
jgi:DNA-directed RNA polymerase specialized sigma24 family protein